MFNHKREEIESRLAVRKLLVSGGLAVALLALMVAGLGKAQARESVRSAPQAAASLARFDDPVVITGSHFSAFSGVPLNELVLYTYRGGDWQTIPFQIDEVDISGTYVISDGGLLDANDELVFMAGDAGDSVGALVWPADAQARSHERYAITVSDPLSASQQAWVYLYRSTTLTRSNASYITWTYETQTASALSYTAAFSPTRFVGLSDLFLNGGTGDILDRQKIRLATFLGTLNEESIVTLLGAATITLPIAGPVRAVANDGDLKAAFYGSRLDFDITFDFSGLPLTPSSVRTSFDWISPTLSGLTTYYDSNTPGGVAIDGVPDVVSTTPRINWFQINGGAAGPGGLVMTIPRVDPHGGTVSNYYKDDGADDANDTGDRRSYGDSGLRINGPFASPAAISFTLSAYILPPGSNTNVGATYFARANTPLQAAAVPQCYTPTGDCAGTLVPPTHVSITGTTVTLVDYPQTYVANVDPITASLPLTYTWQATAQSPLTIADGLSTSVTFTWTSPGPKMISVTVYNEGGAANAEALTIWVRNDAFTPPAHVGITGTTAARLDYPQTYVAAVGPVTASVPLTYMWQATDQLPLTLVNGLSGSATFTWTSAGFKHISVTVYNEGGMVSADPFFVEVRAFTFLPLVLKSTP